ncbi:hypothetical protein [Janthinobacterium sp. J1-1]|uniref:hypothetical protein n=1 Tax=Janthinobacterium sp. J1-1 TaxID=3065910 RepID=UPI00281229DC|nr:hypothetical protein [Janthinobacterium sp. J1-1]
MPLFWTIWACVVVGLLLLVSYMEVSGARNGFQGANGIFLFASGYMTLLTSPILFIVTWIWVDLLTALIVWGIAAAVYAALFYGMLQLIDKLLRKPS